MNQERIFQHLCGYRIRGDSLTTRCEEVMENIPFQCQLPEEEVIKKALVTWMGFIPKSKVVHVKLADTIKSIYQRKKKPL